MALNKDAYERAKYMLQESIDIPTYYNDVVNSRVNLLSQSLVCCPLHDETTPSFKYFSETKSFYCFGCERSGSIVELHHHLVQRSNENYTKSRAVIDLSKDYKIKIPNIFDDTFVDEVKLFKYEAPRINEQIENIGHTEHELKPVNWLLIEIEKKLKTIKKVNLNSYMQICNELDRIYLVDINTQKKLTELLENL